jgi:hypothetical protein
MTRAEISAPSASPSDSCWARPPYAEVAWFLTPWLQVAGRYERARTTLDAFSGGSPLLRHDEGAVGLNFWVDPSLVLKLSGHHVRGARFVAPGGDAGSVEDRTNLVFAGAQFTF